MVLVLDSNEYVFSFGKFTKAPCISLIERLKAGHAESKLRIPRLIVNEVKRNVSPQAFEKFIAFLKGRTTVDEDFLVPFELGAKYEARGLKSADAFIAAYAEWVGASFLITENRHFLTRQKNLPFKVRSAEQSLRLLK